MNESPNLRNARNDARLVAKTFTSLGFETVLIEDGTVQSIYEGLERLKKSGRNASLGVVYYAGHGMEVDGVNYVVPVGARLTTKASARSETVPLENILRDLSSANIQAKMVILDCCRNNPFVAGRGWAQSRANNGGLAVIDQMPESTLIMFSAGPGQTASDGAGVNSPFTEIFSEVVTKPGISCFEAFFRVSDHVKARTNAKQQPWVKFDGAADAFRKFTFKGVPPQTIDAVTGVVQIGKQDYENMKEEMAKLKAAASKAQASGHTPVTPVAASQGGQSGPDLQARAEESLSIFLRGWESNQGANSAEAWASDFSDFPTYCYYDGSGGAPKNFIIEDREKLIKKYPYRTYEMLGKATAEWFDNYSRAVLVVSFHYKYTGQKNTQGNAFVTMGMKKYGNGWKIVSFEESIRRNAYKPSGGTPQPQAVVPQGGGQGVMNEAGLNQFLGRWAKNNASNSSADWVSDFAPSVAYCYKNNGNANHAYLLDDRAKLIKKYPARTYQVVSATYNSLTANLADVTVVYDYDYGRATGRCRTQMKLVLWNGRIVISSFDESIVRK